MKRSDAWRRTSARSRKSRAASCCAPRPITWTGSPDCWWSWGVRFASSIRKSCVTPCNASPARSTAWRAARRVGLRCEAVGQFLQSLCKLLRAFLRRLVLGWSKRDSQLGTFDGHRHPGDDAALEIVKKGRHGDFGAGQSERDDRPTQRLADVGYASLEAHGWRLAALVGRAGMR